MHHVHSCLACKSADACYETTVFPESGTRLVIVMLYWIGSLSLILNFVGRFDVAVYEWLFVFGIYGGLLCFAISDFPFVVLYMCIVMLFVLTILN